MYTPEEILRELEFEAPRVINWNTTFGMGAVEAESSEALICNIVTVDDNGDVIHFQRTLQKDDPRVMQERIRGVPRGCVVWCQTETSLSTDTDGEREILSDLYYISE